MRDGSRRRAATAPRVFLSAFIDVRQDFARGLRRRASEKSQPLPQLLPQPDDHVRGHPPETRRCAPAFDDSSSHRRRPARRDRELPSRRHAGPRACLGDPTSSRTMVPDRAGKDFQLSWRSASSRPSGAHGVRRWNSRRSWPRDIWDARPFIQGQNRALRRLVHF